MTWRLYLYVGVYAAIIGGCAAYIVQHMIRGC